MYDTRNDCIVIMLQQMQQLFVTAQPIPHVRIDHVEAVQGCSLTPEAMPRSKIADWRASQSQDAQACSQKSPKGGDAYFQCLWDLALRGMLVCASRGALVSDTAHDVRKSLA
jgi:hypothetical protein